MFIDRFKMAGRGRGRGRGTTTATTVEIRPGETSNGLSTPKTEITTTKEPVAVVQVDKFDELCVEFKSLKLTADDASLNDLANKAKDLSKSDDECFKIIDLLYQKVFQDNEFAGKVAKLGNILSSLDEIGGKFRSSLLKRAQEHYKNRENLRKDAASEWTGLFCLICEIFKVLRISGQPLKPLSGPIFAMFGELLQHPDDPDQIDCFHVQMRNIGKMLSEIDKEKMDNLVSQIRDSILSNKSTPATRCLLIEVLELQASNWSLSPEVERFYGDAMTEILAS